ncbi:ABC transporter substrate-binding protein [Paenibacillus alvei]|uniref:ABC transporter substrate-binding protein n=2 Tax=Paenibacillus alvei TaxID=44250 RepID=A0ABT4H317_PAEAL|nr:ABC transporter substrate-binding protein [Paenibacillus alvei]MCY9541488.1 ABC transporter substrate-binding protein [Paenibacillus alvei]MCY9705295.1 ABC transporter substrate-binding protein [Paenibacillus alvei]MCY9735022.1 ABC transporter substrate-binding protein [Paenibacillus alvei]MCY9754235.1 ABC transporter substrate-binding protein [Paenibacillus alvei]MCY9763366.1 ABC transporter substrate-binding protein [Paenibacillus alvei]
MKKSRRHLVMTAMMSLLILFAAACGNGGASNSSGSEGSGESTGSKSAEGKKVKIGITQVVNHASLDEAYKGFVQALKDSGYVEGENLVLDYQNAQGDQTNAATIAQKFATGGVDLILGIGTSVSQAAAKETKDIPVLFTAVTDPAGAGLVQSMESPGGNVTGTTDLHPEAISKLMEFIKNSIKNMTTVGIIANEGEQNTVVNVQKAEESLTKLGLSVVKAPVTNSSEVKQAAESLIGKVQAIYVPSDNTVVSALNSVIGVGNDNKIPVFVAEKDSVKNGGVASFGFEYFDLGYTTGKMAVEILKDGKKPSEVPARIPESLDLALNLKAAEAQGFEVTDAMKQQVKPENLFQ